MIAPQFLRTYPRERDLADVEGNVANALRPLLGAIDAVRLLFTDVQLGTNDVEFEHGLKNGLIGYCVVRRSGPAIVYDAPSNNPRRFIRLSASAPVTVSLLVF